MGISIAAINIIAKSKHAFELYHELYTSHYPNGGPSMSSYCEGRNKKDNCGCWVHQLIGMINDGK